MLTEPYAETDERQNTTAESNFNVLNDMLDSRGRDEQQKQLDRILTSMSKVEKELHDTKTQLSEMNDGLNDHEARISNVEKRADAIDDLNREVKELSWKVDDLENRSKRDNLFFWIT